MKNKTVIKKLIKKKITISTVESCTGGNLAGEITSVPNSSKIFNLGLITYSNISKQKLLKIKKIKLKKFGAVSSQVCAEMVENLYKLTNSKLCVSTTGIAGPSGGSFLKPVGLVFVGIKYKKKTKIFMFNFKKKLSRSKIQRNTIYKIFSIINNLI